MNFFESHILESLIYLSMLTAITVLLVPKHQQDWLRVIAITSGTLLLAGSIYVFATFDYSNDSAPYQMLRTYPWLSQLGIDFRLGVDGLAAPMVLLTGIVIFTGSLVSWEID